MKATLSRVFVKDGERCMLVPFDEVRLIESEGNYARLYWKGEQPLLLRSLVAFEERLHPTKFFRANRKHLINIEFVASVDVGVGGRLHATLHGGPEVEISRRMARQLRARLGA